MANPKVTVTQLFINNEFVNSVSGKTFPVVNPSTGEKYVEIQEADKADVDKAVKAARAAFCPSSPWRKMEAKHRAELLNKLADLIARDGQTIAALESQNMGKPISDAKGDVALATDLLRYYAGWCDKIYGQVLPMESTSFGYTRREPIGVAGIVLPWNFPVMLLAIKLGPALAAGCTAVIKPAEQTPITALHVATLIKEAGFPAGVVNIVPGYGPTAGQAISSHMDIDKVAFTGSTEVGRLIMEAAAKSNLKRVSLELGGKSPLIIFADADLDVAAKGAHDAVMFNSGQVCCAATRTYVESSIYDKFVEKSKLLAQQRAKLVGDPLDATIAQGPQVDKEQFTKVLSYIDIGKKEGASCVAGGEAAASKGFFVQPTVFSNASDDMKIVKDEIFGPVQCILKFDNIDEVLKRANATRYGLAAGVFTTDVSKALKIANSLEAGTVWVNCWGGGIPTAPFGGYKESGFGRDMGLDAIHEFTQVKSVIINVHQ